MNNCIFMYILHTYLCKDEYIVKMKNVVDMLFCHWNSEFD